MKNVIRFFLVLLVITVFFLTKCTNQKPSAQEVNELTSEQLVQRGEYLVTIMGCHDCHSPKNVGPQTFELIPELMLSGYSNNHPQPEAEVRLISKGMSIFNPDLTASAGPWGISYAANLTSDQTGIGNWTEENFKRALKQGLYKGIEGSRTLLPPMPWLNFQNITDEDVNAIFAFLKSTPPVSNVVPFPIEPEALHASK